MLASLDSKRTSSRAPSLVVLSHAKDENSGPLTRAPLSSGDLSTACLSRPDQDILWSTCNWSPDPSGLVHSGRCQVVPPGELSCRSTPATFALSFPIARSVRGAGLVLGGGPLPGGWPRPASSRLTCSFSARRPSMSAAFSLWSVRMFFRFGSTASGGPARGAPIVAACAPRPAVAGDSDPDAADASSGCSPASAHSASPSPGGSITSPELLSFRTSLPPHARTNPEPGVPVCVHIDFIPSLLFPSSTSEIVFFWDGRQR